MGRKLRPLRRHGGVQMIRIRDIKLAAGHKNTDMLDEIAKIMCLDMIYPGNSYPDFSYEILKRSVDARKKPDIYFVYTVLLLISDEDEKKIIAFADSHLKIGRIKKMRERIITDPVCEFTIPECGNMLLKTRPVVVGAGPAGLFAALLLARSGFCPILIERGEPVYERSRSVAKFWETGELKAESNVQFGEGGAGTFSDGKLNTLTKDTNGRNTFVIRTFYEHGAPKDILTDAKPHIGTDVLKQVVKSIREEIKDCGGEVFFNTKLTGFEADNGRIGSVIITDLLTGKIRKIKTDICILCIGHSARDTFEMLHENGISMSQKSFAVGFRIVHEQSLVNKWQYGTEDAASLGLPPADYKVTNTTGDRRRVYSFCMCPGGYVVNASSEEGRVCVNGMSEHKRDGKYANSALIVAIDPDDFCQKEVTKDHPLAGMYYQRGIEEEASKRGMGYVPAQYFADFENDTTSAAITDYDGAVRGKTTGANLRGIFSDDIDKALIESMHKFGYTMKGFDAGDVLMLGVEARTSSPVRIMRDEGFESNIAGLYPCGEGAGYAGGITSAAADGIKCAVSIIEKYHYDKKGPDDE